MKENYRVSIFGAAHVGKTEIVNRFCYENQISRGKKANKNSGKNPNRHYSKNKNSKRKEFEMKKYTPTIEDFHLQTFDFYGVSLSLEIVDTCGTEQFPAMRKLNIERSQLVILVYDMTRDETIYEAIRLYQIVRSIHPVSSGITVMLVGAKADLLGRSNNSLIIEEFAQQNTDIWLRLLFCSAKTGFNINKIFKIGFETILPEITANEELKKMVQQSTSIDDEPVSPLVKTTPQDKHESTHHRFLGMFKIHKNT